MLVLQVTYDDGKSYEIVARKNNKEIIQETMDRLENEARLSGRSIGLTVYFENDILKPNAGTDIPS